MLKSRRILQRKRLTATQPNYSLAFTKWLGRSLTRHEKEVIMTLEQLRQRGETVRIHIHDHYGVDSREILTEYLRWLMELEPTEQGAFVCITKKEAKERSRHFHRKPLTSGHWKVDSLRSFTVKFALMLDITRYDWLKLDIGALAPCIPITAQNAAFILHTDPDTCLYIPPAYRVPYFEKIKQEVLEYIDVVFLSPEDSEEKSPPPNKLLNPKLLIEYGEAVLPQAAAAPAVKSQIGSKSTLTFWKNLGKQKRNSAPFQTRPTCSTRPIAELYLGSNTCVEVVARCNPLLCTGYCKGIEAMFEFSRIDASSEFSTMRNRNIAGFF